MRVSAGLGSGRERVVDSKKIGGSSTGCMNNKAGQGYEGAGRRECPHIGLTLKPNWGYWGSSNHIKISRGLLAGVGTQWGR